MNPSTSSNGARYAAPPDMYPANAVISHPSLWLALQPRPIAIRPGERRPFGVHEDDSLFGDPCPSWRERTSSRVQRRRVSFERLGHNLDFVLVDHIPDSLLSDLRHLVAATSRPATLRQIIRNAP